MEVLQTVANCIGSGGKHQRGTHTFALRNKPNMLSPNRLRESI